MRPRSYFGDIHQAGGRLANSSIPAGKDDATWSTLPLVVIEVEYVGRALLGAALAAPAMGSCLTDAFAGRHGMLGCGPGRTVAAARRSPLFSAPDVEVTHDFVSTLRTTETSRARSISMRMRVMAETCASLNMAPILPGSGRGRGGLLMFSAARGLARRAGEEIRLPSLSLRRRRGRDQSEKQQLDCSSR